MPVKPAQQRDWQALPAGVLQHIFYRASSWQRPGTCVAAPVCRSWCSAAAGCSRIRLLYHAGHEPADESFATWLEHNSGQLGALTISDNTKHAFLTSSEEVIRALAEAAAAAKAADRPLPLHTLRLLGGGTVCENTTGQLLAALPHLRCLQLGMDPESLNDEDDEEVLEALASLQQATQLQELYLEGPGSGRFTIDQLLPPSLQRLSWGYDFLRSQDLSHLTKCSFLRLSSSCKGVRSSHLPPRLQQVELRGSGVGPEVVEEQQEVVTSWGDFDLEQGEVQRVLPRLPNLKAATVAGKHLRSPAAQAALKQASKLSALTVYAGDVGRMDPRAVRPEVQAAITATVATAAGMRCLRSLHLRCKCLTGVSIERIALADLQQLTQLRVSSTWQGSIAKRHQRAWVEQLGRLQRLRWLSVPDVLLGAGWGWLGGLQQLRVLVLHCMDAYAGVTWESGMPWMEGCSREALPRCLQVLGVGGITAEQARACQLRSELQQRLGSSGCQVVVGVDLDEVCDPAQQLAGLPKGLQQALA